MGSHDHNIKYLMGQFRHSQSVNDDTLIRFGLENKSNLVQPDESVFVLNAYQQYDIEKNKSTKYRLSGKLRVITDNSIGGAWNTSPSTSDWDPILKDNNNITKNWIIQVTYPSEIDEDFLIKGTNQSFINNPIPTNIVETKASEGVQIKSIGSIEIINGLSQILVKTIQKHAILPGEYIYLKPLESGQTLKYLGLHRVSRLDPNDEDNGLVLETEFDGPGIIYKGNIKRIVEPSLDDVNFYNTINITQIQGCDEIGALVGPLTHTKIITQNHDLQVNDFVDIRFNDSSSLNGVWRVVSTPSINDFVIKYEIPNVTGNIIGISGNNITNEPLTLNYRKIDGTPSEYYIRKFEVLTEVKDYEVYKSGFETTIFTDQYSNKTSLYHFNKDVDIAGLTDNLGRPLTELYTTITRRSSYGGSDSNSYRGWSNVTSFFDHNKNVVTINGIEPSLILETLSFWQNNDNTSTGTIQYPNIGNKLIGDFVEFNRGELLEKKISDIVYRFRPTEVDPATTNPNNAIYTTNREGYYYYPHNKIEIRKFSQSIQSETQKDDEVYPSYVISDNNGNFIWRNILNIGFIEPGNNGIDYPFINGCHYLFNNYSIYIRKQLPTGAIDFSVIETEFKNPGGEISGEKC